MNILFLTVLQITDISARGIYTDLMRKFRAEGHNVCIVSPSERRYHLPTALTEQDGVKLLNVKTLNIQKTNVIEKGIGIILLEHQFRRAVKNYLSDIHFDVVLYSTPPIMLTKVIQYVKKHDKAKSYLILKDIFPQNAVDIAMLKEDGLLYNYFRKKEKKLYELSDFIGCMSQSNIDFVKKYNPTIDPVIIEVCPNSIELVEISLSSEENKEISSKYKIPSDRTVFIYAGNLGKPQGIEFLLEVIGSNTKNIDTFFVVVGSGTEFKKASNWFSQHQPKNAILIPGLPKQEYDQLVQACDVGLIFLDKRFTIPNYPSRLLSYLECKMPVIAATDANTDIGTDAEKNNYGFWAMSDDLEKINQHICNLTNNPELVRKMGENGYTYLLENFTVEKAYQTIMRHFS